MKKILLSLISVAAVGSASAQNQPNLPPPRSGTAPVAPTARAENPAPSGSENGLGAGGAVFTNRFGAAYTFSDLAAQLANLRAAVEQVQPMLSAFNQEYASTQPGNSPREQLTNSIAHILSGLLNRNQNTNEAAASGGTRSEITNILAGAINSFLNTNQNDSEAAAKASATLAEQLQKLQADLQPVAILLQRLNVPTGISSQASGYATRPANPGATGEPNLQDRRLAPTGR